MLTLNNITIRFQGLTAIDHVCLEVKDGCIFGLIGPNGAGKTTLFNIISGIFKPDEGDVLLQGEQIKGLRPHQINALGISRTYQNINLFRNLSVLDNVKIGYHRKIHYGLLDSILRDGKMRQEEKVVSEECRGLLQFMGLEEKQDYLAKNLSYGEQRRLEIARALASGPKLLLLDEPAAGMNNQEKMDLVSMIQKINRKGITIFIVEHDMKLIMSVTSEIAVLNYGKKIAQGTPAEIRTQEEVIAAYLGK